MMAASTAQPGIPLARLLDGLVTVAALPNVQPAGLQIDSRRVRAGDLFLACDGLAGHGMDHVAQAADRGACAVLAEPSDRWSVNALLAAGAEQGIPVIVVSHLSARVGELAARYFGRPSAALKVIGITGTNGKTSVSHFMAAALSEGQDGCGVIGTLGYGMPGSLKSASHTTPDAIRVQEELAALRDAGAGAVAMEVSSHALAQHRVAGVGFHTVVFTNLSRDHLDYHGDMKSYGETKATLFARPDLELAVINRDDPFGRELIRRHRGAYPIVACGVGGDMPAGVTAVTARDIRSYGDGLGFTLLLGDERVTVRTGVLGRFNVDNLLLVAGVLHGWGVSADDIATRLARLQTVPGRMQRLGGGDRPVVVVDYAHTPDALAQTLKALRPHTRGQLICVFGCGGDRDAGKRPQMGRIAEQLADQVVVTDDNPRSEDGGQIARAVLEGMAAPKRARVQRDRARAIAEAIAGAGAEDVVLIAGKGHETYQLVGDLSLPFSDVEQARKALGGGA